MPDNVATGKGGIPVATGNNRVSSQGNITASTAGQASRIIATSIAAGATIPFAVAGTQFYLAAASAAVNIRQHGGEFVSYVQGTGLQVKQGKAFDSMEVSNPHAFPVVIQLFVGFDGFIDNRVFNVSQTTPSVAFPTYKTATSAPAVAITDLSGQGFFDINGVAWLALARIAIVISNLDTGVTVLVQATGALTSSGPAIAAVFPLTSWVEGLSGNYSLNVGGGNINCLVHEIYQAIPPTF